ncbi:HNH endonuclease [Rhizobium sp. 2YAF20]|uniref:HNH endonuclease n=1 Tax=Rhizobium sp. 2YAF20 TaxID=3233027 RepID=UPI003F95E1A8
MTCEDSIQETIELAEHIDRQWDVYFGRYLEKPISPGRRSFYCESKLRHITHGDIEHIAPNSKVPTKAYAWENLTLACDVCNENKGDHFSTDPEKSHDNLIDPYADEPADRFLFLREAIAARPDSFRAKATDAVIKLSRIDLLERRRERMAFIDGLVSAYCQAPAQFKELLWDDLVSNHLTSANEYAATSQAYVRFLNDRGVIDRQLGAGSEK